MGSTKGEGEIQEAAPSMSQPSCPSTSKTKRNSKADVRAFAREDGEGGRKRDGKEDGKEGKNTPEGEASRNSV